MSCDKCLIGGHDRLARTQCLQHNATWVINATDDLDYQVNVIALDQRKSIVGKKILIHIRTRLGLVAHSNTNDLDRAADAALEVLSLLVEQAVNLSTDCAKT